MIKIGLISDTHGHWDDSISRHLEGCDEVWHAGDIGALDLASKVNSNQCLRAVFGNIDGSDKRIQYPEFQYFEIEGFSVVLTHIANSTRVFPDKLRSFIRGKKIDILVCGHSHILRMGKHAEGGFLYVNPGACGHHGFHSIRTLLRFELHAGKIMSAEAIELGKRGRGI